MQGCGVHTCGMKKMDCYLVNIEVDKLATAVQDIDIIKNVLKIKQLSPNSPGYRQKLKFFQTAIYIQVRQHAVNVKENPRFGIMTTGTASLGPDTHELLIDNPDPETAQTVILSNKGSLFDEVVAKVINLVAKEIVSHGATTWINAITNNCLDYKTVQEKLKNHPYGAEIIAEVQKRRDMTTDLGMQPLANNLGGAWDEFSMPEEGDDMSFMEYLES